ncbi:aldehyde dehydrogenase family protein [Sulfobacillus harzensis]|uniref:Aldehyde dehydrogenase family protein n=1 Tax=Sulfobacillus harzensis TaxID=2729629 RepID=A0A7Y0L148_9FIRM|nr:aldehyde dehydrogenase family protein [Sulfobacillus harzensis]NMP21374.1 aldehyde dehydrogenase family protein [Sulfobacillus harzensis]
MIEAQNLIGGQEVTTSQRMEVFSPSRPDEVIGHIPQSIGVEVDLAVQAARDALRAWKQLGPMGRSSLMFQAAAILEQRVDELAQLASQEMGKPIGEARGEALRAVAILRYYAGQGAYPVGDVIPAANATTLQYTTREPLGVVGIITPWNFPLAIPMWKVAPALIYGNTVVIKPAELSSLTAYRMFSLIQGLFPPGVLNVVIGRGAEAGAALVQHPGIRGISFTGSSQVGQGIARAAADRGVKYQLEMGGKNAVIVADDANIEQAVELVVSGAMRSAGQKCTATSRVIVLDGIHHAFREALTKRVKSLAVGDPLDANTYLGPVVSASQQKRVYTFIEHAQREGYAAVTGGQLLDRPGYFIAPTVFDEVRPDAEIAQEEVFGPVVAIIPAATLDEAITITNGVRYGLSASVFTRNLTTALKMVDELEVGMVRVNEETAGVEYQAPFGGMKASSSHSREQGLAAREFYTETKTVAIRAM